MQQNSISVEDITLTLRILADVPIIEKNLIGYPTDSLLRKLLASKCLCFFHLAM